MNELAFRRDFFTGNMNILVTGGAGYIGSHACVALADCGFNPVIIDNLVNSDEMSIHMIAKITGRRIPFINADLRDAELVERVLREHQVRAVFHFAGLKSVSDSVARPLDYVDNNLGGTISLLRAMNYAKCDLIVFSSSATVYGESGSAPISEDCTRKPDNPYAFTKIVIEDTLSHLATASNQIRYACLRYFNPVGAHSSGLLGDRPLGVPGNLVPYILDVARNRRDVLSVFGNDYPTIDGTGVRDYVHVMDLVEGHLEVLKYLVSGGTSTCYNLGSGKGLSVIEMIRAFEAVIGVHVPFIFDGRRPGDVAVSIASTAKIERELGWRAKRSVADMCRDTWQSELSRADSVK